MYPVPEPTKKSLNIRMDEKKNLLQNTDLSHRGGRHTGGGNRKGAIPGSVFIEMVI